MTQKQPLPNLSLQGMAQLRRYLPHGGGVVKRTAVCIGSVKPSVAAIRKPQIAKEKKSLMDRKKSADRFSATNS
jgi:hypothetical protein